MNFSNRWHESAVFRFLIFSLFVFPFSAIAVPEKELAEIFETKIVNFFRSVQPGYFYNREGISREIHYRIFRNKRSNNVVVICPGRSESQWLYSELIYDLHEAGFSVAILDHAGQGESRRDMGSAEIQFVENFDEYSQDFIHFLNILSEREFAGPNYKFALLAHSAGSIISLQSLAKKDNPIKFSSIVLTSPMMKIKTSPLPFFIAEPVAKILSLIDKEAMAPFQKKRFDRDFAKYSTAKGQKRRDLLRRLHFENIGRHGLYPSIKWASEALVASRRLRKTNVDLAVPTLVFAAENDNFVDPAATRMVSQVVGASCELTLVNKSSHDIWTESDIRRESVWQKTLAHFKKYF